MPPQFRTTPHWLPACLPPAPEFLTSHLPADQRLPPPRLSLAPDRPPVDPGSQSDSVLPCCMSRPAVCDLSLSLPLLDGATRCMHCDPAQGKRKTEEPRAGPRLTSWFLCFKLAFSGGQGPTWPGPASRWLARGRSRPPGDSNQRQAAGGHASKVRGTTGLMGKQWWADLVLLTNHLVWRQSSGRNAVRR